MYESIFMRAEEVQHFLGVSRNEAYRIIRQLNEELKKKGYLIIAGRVSRQYLMEAVYGSNEESASNDGKTAVKSTVFIKAQEITEKLETSEREAYRIIATLNEELAAAGFLVIRGRTNRRYLEEKLYHCANAINRRKGSIAN